MLNLIIKDILIQKKQFIFAVFYLGILIIAFQNIGASMFSAGVVAFIYMLNMTACASEDKVGSDIMLNSLPVKRVNIVLQKYISLYIYFIIGTLTYIVFSMLLKVIPIPIKTYPPTFETFVAGFIASSVMAILYFPLYFKFGYMKMRIVNFVLFFLAFSGISILARYLQDSESYRFLNIINVLWENNKMLFIAAAALIFVTLMAVSLGLAVYFYKKREF